MELNRRRYWQVMATCAAVLLGLLAILSMVLDSPEFREADPIFSVMVLIAVPWCLFRVARGFLPSMGSSSLSTEELVAKYGRTRSAVAEAPLLSIGWSLYWPWCAFFWIVAAFDRFYLKKRDFEPMWFSVLSYTALTLWFTFRVLRERYGRYFVGKWTSGRGHELPFFLRSAPAGLIVLECLQQATVRLRDKNIALLVLAVLLIVAFQCAALGWAARGYLAGRCDD